jgi:2-phosphosulfolactate phosphatase
MRVHAALTPAEFPGLALPAATAVVIDVLRATTTVAAAAAAGCLRVIPVADAESARRRAAALPPGALLAGERDGEPIPGFDFGNSPLEFTRERVAGRTVILTTTNGTQAMLAAARAGAGAAGALANARAVAAWAAGQGRDVVLLCAGEKGAFCLEDAVCAGLIAARILERRPDAELSDAAVAALRLGEEYAPGLGRLAEDAQWARILIRMGRREDVEACLRLDAMEVVPVFRGDAVVAAALTGPAPATHTDPDRSTGLEPTR